MRVWSALVPTLTLLACGHPSIERAGPPPGSRLARTPALRLPRDQGPLPGGALARLGSLCFQHRAHALAFSPDGQELASLGADERVRLWEVRSGRELRSFPASKAQAVALTGAELAMANGEAAEVIELPSGRPRLRLRFRGSFAVLSRDAKWLALVRNPFRHDEPFVGEHPEVVLIRLERGQVLRTLRLSRSVFSAAALSPDAAVLATGTHDGKLRLHEVSSGRELVRLEVPGGGAARRVHHLLFTDDGEVLVSRGEQGLHLWSVRERRLLGALRATADDGDHPLAFSPRRTLLVAEPAGGVSLQELGGGTEERRRLAVPDKLDALAVSPSGRLLAIASADWAVVRLWDLVTGRQLLPPAGHGASLLQVVCPGSAVLTLAADRRLRRWQGDGRLERTVSVEPWSATRALSSDGRWLAEELPSPIDPKRREVRVLSTETGKPLRDLAGDRPLVRLVMSPRGDLLAGVTAEGVVSVWEVASARRLQRLPLDRLYESAHLAFSEGGRVLAVAGRLELSLVEPRSGRGLGTVGVPTSPLHEVAAGRQGQLALASSSHVYLYTTRPARQVGTLTHDHPSPVQRLDFAPDGRRLLVVGPRTATVHELPGGRLLGRLSGHRDELRDGCFLVGGERVVTASRDGTALVWQVPGTPEAEPRGGPVPSPFAPVLRPGAASPAVRWTSAIGADPDPVIVEGALTTLDDRRAIRSLLRARLERSPVYSRSSIDPERVAGSCREYLALRDRGYPPGTGGPPLLFHCRGLALLRQARPARQSFVDDFSLARGGLESLPAIHPFVSRLPGSPPLQGSPAGIPGPRVLETSRTRAVVGSDAEGRRVTVDVAAWGDFNGDGVEDLLLFVDAGDGMPERGRRVLLATRRRAGARLELLREWE